MEVPLKDGWKIGDSTHMTVELRETNAFDSFEASRNSERLVPTPEGYALVVSNTTLGVEILFRQITKVGSFDGVLSMEMLKGLSTGDLDALLEASETLDTAVAKDMEKRGRDKPPQK